MRSGLEKVFDDVAMCNAFSRQMLADLEEEAGEALANEDLDALMELLPKAVEFARWGVEGVSTLLAQDAAMLV